jgi:hypothetical protein
VIANQRAVQKLQRELEVETNRYRRAQLAERIGTLMLRAARTRLRVMKPCKLEPPPRSEWRPLSDLRKVLQQRSKHDARNE